MRTLFVVMVLCPAWCAFAQEPPARANDPYANPSLPPPSPSAPYAQSAYGASPDAQSAYPPPPVVAAPLSAPATSLEPPTVRATLSRSTVRQWRGARVMNGFAGAIGIMSTALSVTNAIYVAADHYPPSLNDFTRPRPSDPAQTMSYVSSTSAALAFGLSAGGLALRHHILRQLDADPGRGLFLSGTVVGLVGIAAIAVGYIVGFSPMGNAHDQSIAVLTTSLGGSTLCNVATTMYAKDGANMQKIWKSLSTF